MTSATRATGCHGGPSNSGTFEECTTIVLHCFLPVFRLLDFGELYISSI
jgi:hypothetical protein